MFKIYLWYNRSNTKTQAISQRAFKALEINVNFLLSIQLEKPRQIEYGIWCLKLVLWPPDAALHFLGWSLHLVEFTSSWRRENAQSGVVYRTRPVLKTLLDYKIFIHFVLHQ